MTNIRHRFSFFDQCTSAVEAFSCPSRGRFDDFTVTHTKSPVIQAEDYYPFGLVSGSYQRENSVEQNFLYNGKELQTDLDLDWYDYGALMYDASIGRWHVVDPYSEIFEGWSPYNYVYNNPVSYIDPYGEYTIYDFNGNPHEIGDHDVVDGNLDADDKDEDEQFNGGISLVNKPGVGIRKGKNGELESFNTPFTHVCGENCTLNHYTREDELKLFAEAGFFFLGGQAFRLVVRGGKYVFTVVRLSSGFSKFAHASKYGFDSYKALAKLTAGKGLHVHHLIEKRFANLLGSKSDDMLSIVLTETEHQVFTNAWRAEIGYVGSKSAINTVNVTKQQVIEAAKRIYKDYPEILQALKLL